MKSCHIPFFLSVVLPCYLFSQQPNPVQWDFSSKKIDANSFELHLTAIIQSGWHIYSQYNEGGPGPAKISFKKNPLLVRKFDPKEIGKGERINESLFDSRVYAFSEKVDFVQSLFRKKERPTTISGKIKFIACNGNLCLPPKEESFTINLD
jgi:Disulphide bond corrector protein DsbC